MNNWQHLFNNTDSIINHINKPYLRYDNREKSVSNIVFDKYANLLWAGDTYGCISSYDPNLQLYTRYKGHIGGSSVKSIVPLREGILSLSEDALHLSNRRGVTMFNVTSINIAEFSELQTMCPMSIDNHNYIYCAGNNTSVGIICFDLTKVKLTSIINYNAKVKLLKSTRNLLLIGKPSGAIDLLDPRSNQLIKSFICHSDTITSMDIADFTLVTTGKSRSSYNSFADPFVNVFDLRSMKQLAPVSFSKDGNMGTEGASFVQLHPVLPTVMFVGSKSGDFDFIDLSNPVIRTQYIHPGKDIKSMVLSPSGDHIAVLESDNILSTWSRSPHGGNFTSTPEILQYPDFVDDGPPNFVSIDNMDFPLSSVGLPYYNERLLSAWPYTLFNSDGSIPKKIDTSLPLAPVSKNNKQQSLNSTSLDHSSKKFPFYRYDKSKFGKRNVATRYVCMRDLRKKILTGNVDKEEILNYKGSGNEIPPAYSQLPFTYGKYGSNNFDFQSYNKTRYSGLDIDVDNSYTNSIIQLYRFVPEVFNFSVCCLKDENFEKPSLLSELGYLYDMMSRSNGVVCKSANFQTVLNSIPQASELGLLDNNINELSKMKYNSILETVNNNINNTTSSNGNGNSTGPSQNDLLSKSLIQKFNEFLLNRLLKEEFESTGHNITLEQCFGFTVSTEIKPKCNHYNKVTNVEPCLTLRSPLRNGVKQHPKKINNQTILPYIESSMRNIKTQKKICETCGKQDMMEIEKTVNNLPPLMSLQVMLSVTEWKTVRTVKKWLSKEFFASIYKNKIIIKPSYQDLKMPGEVFKYELNGYIARVTDPSTNSSRLVTYARIWDHEQQNFKWYMFNNYLVVEISEEEAFNISYWWKSIEVILYCDSEEIRKPFFSINTYSLNYDILYKDYFSNGIREDYKKQYKLLTRNEPPKEGTLVAIDAEFVLLREELCDIDCQGTKTIIRPKKSSLARISVIRGEEGPLYGVPFIDDYIANKDHVEDYLTKYSGIMPGDLDIEKSHKPLVSREVAYRKIWLLMQIGCIFVGHGLSNDFKLININVPKEQIRDTAVYFLQGKRYLSLKYLAFALLGKNVQQDNHDSIEDAYTALILYKKYLDIKETGNLPKVIETLYEEGRASNYKVPESVSPKTKT